MKANEVIKNWKSLIETATVGASASGSIACVPGTLGAGFGDDMSKSIYTQKKKSRKKSGVMIRR